MVWTISVKEKVTKAIDKMDKKPKQQIQHFLTCVLPNLENPRSQGKNLTGILSHLWRYRIGDYRVLCEIRDKELVIIAVNIGDRRDVYKSKK